MSQQGMNAAENLDDFMLDDEDDGLEVSSSGYHDFSFMNQPTTALAEDVFNPMDDYY